MMNKIFVDISESVDPFKEYTDYMCMERTTSNAVGKKAEDKIK